MPVDTCGFVLKPHGFFGRNPAMDVPRSSQAHATAETCGGGDGCTCAH